VGTIKEIIPPKTDTGQRQSTWLETLFILVLFVKKNKKSF